ncbi:MAG: FkbM family methyltransferase [Gallionellaceae bacterium]|nr:FkbM family methyltransferase [Gallionellaceae bacterium]
MIKTDTHKYFAQYGEDKILDQIFGKKEGVCVEVGGFDGVTGSNSYYFEKLGWRCLVVEPMPDFCQKIRAARSCEIAEIAASDKKGESEFYVAVGVEVLSTMQKDANHFARIKSSSQEEMRKITVKTARLDDIFLEHGITTIDFMTIDVGGHEMSALAGMSFGAISPRIVIIEDNSGGLDTEVKDFMKSVGYTRFKRTGNNDWYTKKNEAFFDAKQVALLELKRYLSVKWRKFKLLLKKARH